MLNIHTDLTIPFPEPGCSKLSDFKEKVEAACRTAEFLGFEDAFTDDDVDAAESAVIASVYPEQSTQKVALRATEEFKPATYYAAKAILTEHAVRVVDNANQIRLLVTNKLLLESDNPDPRIRMRALELLGKITDVGLFTEKSEVTVTHRSTEDLVNNIRAKIAAMREPKDITPTTGHLINVDEELGL